jgi:hypothetical protein
MKKIILKSLQLQSQMKVLHWQTASYAEHKAFGRFYDKAGGIIDQLIEAIQGKYNCRILLGGIDSIQISDYSNLKINMFLMDMENFFANEIYLCGINKAQDPEIENILHELRAAIDKLKYLLTLK